jgi:septal ring factor EnvC (AmiA/AmiB activator)
MDFDVSIGLLVIGLLAATVIVVLIVLALRRSGESQRLHQLVRQRDSQIAQLQQELSARQSAGQQLSQRLDELERQLGELEGHFRPEIHRLKLDRRGNLLEEA